MRRLIGILLLISSLTLSLTSCGEEDNGGGQNEVQEITLTKENFEDYFSIEVDSDIDITKHGDNYLLGVYVPPTYTAVADVEVNVFATSPIDSYNVVVTLEVTTGYVYWNTKTVTLNLNSSGSASKNITITTSDEQDIYFESDCKKSFYARITGVQGTVKVK